MLAYVLRSMALVSTVGAQELHAVDDGRKVLRQAGQACTTGAGVQCLPLGWAALVTASSLLQLRGEAQQLHAVDDGRKVLRQAG